MEKKIKGNISLADFFRLPLHPRYVPSRMQLGPTSLYLIFILSYLYISILFHICPICRSAGAYGASRKGWGMPCRQVPKGEKK